MRVFSHPLVALLVPVLGAALIAGYGPTAAAAPDTKAAVAPATPGGVWLGEELPLPLVVKTPQDLALKAVAERQYLVFNLLARGKLAWDAGDFATAASRWEALLKIPGIDPELDRVVRPLAADARARSGGAALPAGGDQPTPAPAGSTPAPSAAAAGASSSSASVVPMVSVSGQVS